MFSELFFFAMAVRFILSVCRGGHTQPPNNQIKTGTEASAAKTLQLFFFIFSSLADD